MSMLPQDELQAIRRMHDNLPRLSIAPEGVGGADKIQDTRVLDQVLQAFEKRIMEVKYNGAEEIIPGWNGRQNVTLTMLDGTEVVASAQLAKSVMEIAASMNAKPEGKERDSEHKRGPKFTPKKKRRK